MGEPICTVPNCGRATLATDLCSAHYNRRRTHGDIQADRPVISPGTPAEARFWAKVQRGRDTQCWLWTGAVGSHGYGNFWTGQRYARAHRYAYELARGPIPEVDQGRTVLDHRCRNKRCVNPRHLDPVTDRVNTHRGVSPAAINVTKTHCRRGHPYDAANTYIRPPGSRPGRDCKECRQQRNRLASQRRSASRNRR